MPHPLDGPRTLLAPAPATPTATCADLPGPYFENNPLWDDRALPQPGWFVLGEVAVVVPHIRESISGLVQVPGGNLSRDLVKLPNAPLD